MSDERKPIDLVGLRRLAADTWEVSVKLSLHHLTQAEKPNDQLSTPQDIVPTQAAEARRESHTRLAAVYAQLASACHKVPGSQF